MYNYAHPTLDTLAVAKWENAFERSGTTLPPVIQVKGDFIDQDPDRFFVSVRDPAGNKNPNVQDTIKVHISTSSDTGNDIVLKEVLNNTGLFYSDYLLLTSVKVDKTKTGTSGFFVKLGDTVEAAYDWQAVTATVPVQKVVKLNILILFNKKLQDGGKLVASKNSVEGDVNWANQIYAPLGIRFKVEYPIKQADPPRGVDLSNGLEEATNGGPSTEEKALFDAGYQSAADNDIEVWYVNYLADNGVDSHIGGEAFPESRNGVNAKYVDSIIISEKNLTYRTLAHEIGHILLNAGGHPDGKVDVNQVNLMASPSKIAYWVTDSRRITAKQAEDMLSKRPNLLSKP